MSLSTYFLKYGRHVGQLRRLCLNPTAQKDNRGVLVASFRVEQFSEICRVFQYGGL